MPNIVFTNNGSQARPAVPANEELGTEFIPAQPATPSISVLGEDGHPIEIKPGDSLGLPLGRYTIEVLP